MCLIAVLGKGNTSEYLILPSVGTAAANMPPFQTCLFPLFRTNQWRTMTVDDASAWVLSVLNPIRQILIIAVDFSTARNPHKGQKIKFFMMDDYRRPLDGNSCRTQGRDPKLSSEWFQLHCQSPWTFGGFKLNFWRISVTSWIDLDSNLKNLSMESFLCPLCMLSQAFSQKKWSEEIQ